MARVHRIRVQMMNDETFRLFGRILSRRDTPPDFRGVHTIAWKTSFEIDDAPEIMFLRTEYNGLRFTKLERHFKVTQTFVPVGRVPAVVAVAAPTDASEVPAPEDVRGFVVDGTVGYALHRGTWHSVDRYALYPPASESVIVTSRKTQIELETASRAEWQFTQEIDYETKFGIVFELDVSACGSAK